MKLSIVIPAHNEEFRLPSMLEAYATFFSEKYGEDVELIVVPNHCDDKTAEVARGIAERFPLINVMADPGRVGKGGAVMLGARVAAGTLVGFVDADGATPPAAFNDLVEKIDDAGCIIASRWLKASDVEPRQPLSRRFASRCFNLLVRLMFGLRITDTQCGAKVFQGDVMKHVLDNLGVTNWAFDVDMLFQTKRLGAPIREIPTVWHDVEGSKIEVVRASRNMLIALVRLRLYYSPICGIIPYLSRFAEKVVGYGK